MDKFRSIYFNLNPKSSVKNKELLKNIKKGKIKTCDVAFMRHQNLNPSKWKEIIDKKIQRDIQKMLKKGEPRVPISLITPY